jgi:hypothetical protein
MNSQRIHFYLPIFTNYSDYDFRNDQSFDLFEDLFWETSYSSYNFADYIGLSKETFAGQFLSLKDAHLEQTFHKSTLGLDVLKHVNSNGALRDTSCQQITYSNSIQMEDYAHSPTTLRMGDYANFTLYSELNEVDDSFLAFKFFSR